MSQNPIEKFVISLCDEPELTPKKLLSMQRDFARGTASPFFNTDELLQTYHNLCSNKTVKRSQTIEGLLRLKNTRSLSGIVVVSVLTKPYECPGKCIYCPTFNGVPKSYLPDEPAVMRALTCKFNPFLQVRSRLRALTAVGHKTDKVNIRIIGGTWSYYPKKYQTWFIKSLFAAANGSPTNSSSTKLDELQEKNELSPHRIVEISIETRQDYIDQKEIKRLRWLGITKVELGVQSIYDKVLLANNRGNTDSETIRATKLLKEAGFKVSYQMMLNLAGSDLDQDQSMFRQLFGNQNYKPDHLKIYPLALVRQTSLFDLYQKGKYLPYSEGQLVTLLKKIKQNVPRYCRIERVIRDIPASNIVCGGAKISNLRQMVLLEMFKQGTACNCIRCREIKSGFSINEKFQLTRLDYGASDGKEIFLSIESSDHTKLLSLLRLRVNAESSSVLPSLRGAGIIREIHTYGPQVSIGEHQIDAAQHQGWGKKLVCSAEEIIKKEFGLRKVAVIAGVGVRPYFRKLGYKLEDSYMVKNLD